MNPIDPNPRVVVASATAGGSQTITARIAKLWQRDNSREHLEKAARSFNQASLHFAAAQSDIANIQKPIPKRPGIDQSDVFNSPEEKQEEKKPPPPPGPRPPGCRNQADLASAPLPAVSVEPETAHKSHLRYPFLRICLFSIDRRTKEWKSLSELDCYKSAIAEFYEQEFRLREIFVDFSLKEHKGWMKAEKRLVEYDRPHLSVFMKHLKEALQNPECLDPDCKDLPEEELVKKASELPEDCFEALWEMILEPRILRKLKILRLDEIDFLKEIPVGFSLLSFSRLKELSFARHPIERLPKKIRVEFQWIDGKRQPIGKPRHFFDGCSVLEVLDFSGCELSEQALYHLFSFSFFFGECREEIVEEGDVFVEKTVEVREYMPALKWLKKIDLSNNCFTGFPLVFKIHPDRFEKSLVIDMTNNGALQTIPKSLLPDLCSSEPIQITLDVRNNHILESFIEKNDIQNQVPANVHLAYGTVSMKADIPELLRPKKEAPASG